MKKFLLPIIAFIFAGVFDDTAAAVDGAMPGAGTQFNFTETENEAGKTLSFTDNNGNSVTASKGDAIVLCNDESGTATGFILMPAYVAATLQDAPEAAATS